MGNLFSYTPEEIENQNLKNKDYYTGDRYFKISRKYYPQFTRGYFYSYYEDLEYYDKLSLQEDRERAIAMLTAHNRIFHNNERTF
jgi:hypothetical protein